MAIPVNLSNPVATPAAAAPGPPPAALTLRLRALHAPKEGNTESEYEDAFACQKPPTPPPGGGTAGAAAAAARPPQMSSFTVAVSDGASSSVFARQWARLLVNDFARGPFPPAPDANERVTLLGRKWRQQVEAGPLPWYAQEKLVQGSHASLLVVTWDLQGQRTFSARAIGDSCLFVIRDDALHHAFPVTKSSDFGNHPTLLSTELGRASSDGAGVAPLPPTFAALDRPYEPGDRFLLMTDALAGWFLAEYEGGRKPWNHLPAEQKAFAPWLQVRRDSGAMKNDDVTLLVLSVLPATPPA
jgi:hypothetical protein